MKYLLLLIVFLIPTLASRAQKFEGGVLGGVNGSQVRGDFTSGYQKPGINAGAYVNYNWSEKTFWGMELRFSQKGSRKNPDAKTGDQYKYIMRLNYIDIPVYAGYRSNDRISVFGGLSAGYLISGNEYNNYGLFPKEDRRPFNDFDVQALAGIRVKFTSRLSLDIRGAYSVVPIRDNPGEVLWYWLDSQFNNVLSTSLFYRLDF